MRFEWDPGKASANLRKHGVSFEEAAECFADPLAMFLIELKHSGRAILIGESRSCRLIFSVFLEKQDDEVIRIISARKATRAERSKYEEGDF